MSLFIVGQGLHTGGQVQVELQKMPAGYGLRLFVGHSDHEFLHGGLNPNHILLAPRTTLLSDAEQTLRMPEHLFAALLGWPTADLQIRVLHGEVPILDGSARPWVDALTSILGEASSLVFYECALESRLDFEHGFWEVRPSVGNFLELELSLDQHGYQDQVSLRIHDLSDLKPIFSARTFIFEPDFHSARSMGMLSGAEEGSGLVVSTEGGGVRALHGGPLRDPHELCLHKALDLCGDIALLRPQLPKLKIRIHNGGHWAHHHMIKRIQSLCP